MKIPIICHCAVAEMDGADKLQKELLKQNVFRDKIPTSEIRLINEIKLEFGTREHLRHIKAGIDDIVIFFNPVSKPVIVELCKVYTQEHPDIYVVYIGHGEEYRHDLRRKNLHYYSIENAEHIARKIYKDLLSTTVQEAVSHTDKIASTPAD